MKEVTLTLTEGYEENWYRVYIILSRMICNIFTSATMVGTCNENNS